MQYEFLSLSFIPREFIVITVIIKAISVFSSNSAMTLNIGDIATGAAHTTGKSAQIINNDVSREANIQI